MEKKTVLQNNGQELQTDDVNTMGASGGLADDRVLADLLRMALDVGTGIAKAVLPYGTAGDTSSTVAPSGLGDGSVVINPFRSVVGSRTPLAGIVSTDALASWRDIRSGVFVGGGGSWSAVPPTSLQATQLIGANASGFARWDLIYAVMTPDTAVNSVQRAIKTSTGGGVSNTTLATEYSTTITLGYTPGTPSATPMPPAAPADTATTYYVPLAYVAVQNGHGPTTLLKSWQIWPIAATPPSSLSKGMGGGNLSVANQIPVSSSISAWANGSTVSLSGRPPYFLPQEMRGREDLLVAISLPSGSSSGWSHQNGGLVDDSRDWRNRVFKTTIFAQQSTPPNRFSWDRDTSGAQSTTQLIPAYAHLIGTPEVMAGNIAVQFGQSFVEDASNLPGSPPNGSVVCFASNAVLSSTGVAVGLYVDSVGALRVYVGTGVAAVIFFFWVESSGPMPAY